MILPKLKPLADLVDSMQRVWEGAANQRALAIALFWGYALALLAVELQRVGLYPHWLPPPPPNHFYAIHLAFTLILGMEVISLIFAIPASWSRSMGKQFEILTLILLRNAFKELAELSEPVFVNAENVQRVVEIGVSAAGALAVFGCLGLYRRTSRQQRFIENPDMRERYIISKKLLAFSLVVIFIFVAVNDVLDFWKTGRPQNFFETIYTVLIFADIALVLIASQFMPSYHAVFRNSGFVIGTVLMRLALSSPPLWSPVIGLFAALFVVGLTWATGNFSPNLFVPRNESKARAQAARLVQKRPTVPDDSGTKPHAQKTGSPVASQVCRYRRRRP